MTIMRTPTQALDWLSENLDNQKAIFYDGNFVFIGDREDAPVDILKLGEPNGGWEEISENELCLLVYPEPPYPDEDNGPSPAEVSWNYNAIGGTGGF